MKVVLYSSASFFFNGTIVKMYCLQRQVVLLLFEETVNKTIEINKTKRL